MGKDVKRNWKNILIKESTNIFSAIQQMDREAQRVLLVVDDKQRLLGIITDGDIRRYLLKQGDLNKVVTHVMNRNPVTVSITENQDQVLMKMRLNGILHLPVVNNEGRVIGLEIFDNFFTKNTRENLVVFMAGGMGKRLHPLTIDCPKPLLTVGDKPISEILLENFIKSGFKNFYFSVNYKAEMIRHYYGSGTRWGVQIEYIEENTALGTAGSLSLLPMTPDQSFFVINADILTNINFGHVLDFHQEQELKPLATLCVRQHQNTIPFGIVNINEVDHRLIAIEEKPINNYFINAGIYILEPQVLQYLSFNSYCDMPNFLTQLAKKGIHVGTFPIREYWLDIGHQDNLARAVTDYVEVFS